MWLLLSIKGKETTEAESIRDKLGLFAAGQWRLVALPVLSHVQEGRLRSI